MTTTKQPVLTDDDRLNLWQPFRDFPVDWICQYARAIELLALERAGADAVQIPEGYALVPIKPTKEMLAAGRKGVSYTQAPWLAERYVAMLEAAPAIRALKGTPAAVMAVDEILCKGSVALGSGCGKCARCRVEAGQQVAEALDRMDALLDPKCGLLTVSDSSGTVAASRRDLAAIRVALNLSRAELAALLPGTYYMDEPDGGSVTVLEQLRRMSKDADRYRAIRNPPYSDQYGDLYAMSFQGDGDIVVKGAALDDAADAAIAASKGAKP